MPTINEMIPSNYLKAPDLMVDGEYEEVDVTVGDVTEETMLGDGHERKKWVLHVREFGKPLVLNVTNTKKLFELLGPKSEGWVGRRVRLHVTPVSFKGEEVDAIRIKAAKPQPVAAASGEIPF